MEPYFEDVIDEMDVDEDPVTTFDKLILLADDLIVPQKISVKDDMEQESVSEATENDSISRDTPPKRQGTKLMNLTILECSFSLCKKKVPVLLSMPEPVLFLVLLLMRYLNNGMKVIGLRFLLVV